MYRSMSPVLVRAPLVLAQCIASALSGGSGVFDS